MPSTCHLHPDSAAISTCTTCTKPLCAGCLVFERFQSYCAEHAREARRGHYMRQTRLVVFGSFGFLALLGAILAWVLLREPSFSYGKHAPRVRELERHLAGTPCDRAKTVELGDLMVTAGNYRGAVELCDGFFAKCGDYPRLLWVRYEANKRAGDFDEAIADATKLIESDPHDKDYWWWRGMIHEMAGRWEKAAADYEKAIEAEPRLSNIPFNLSAMYEKLSRPCDAARAIERYIEQRPESLESTTVTDRLARLRGECVEAK